MKTAISVDDQLLSEADQTEMLARLNQVYRDAATSPERRTAGRIKTKLRSTIKERW
jgi:hypothetical protein